MEFSYLFYPPHWKNKAWRQQVLEAAGKMCEVCGVKNRTTALNAADEPFMIYLQIAHKDQYLTWHPQAETLVLCQPCHRKFDQQNCRRDKADFILALIGQARISAIYKRRKHLVGLVHTLNELRAIIQAQPEDTLLVVEFEVHQTVVGRGRYMKTAKGVSVIRETGAARNLWMDFIQHQAFRKLAYLNTAIS